MVHNAYCNTSALGVTYNFMVLAPVLVLVLLLLLLLVLVLVLMLGCWC